MIEEKVCKACGQIKPLTAFWKAVENRDGKYGMCKECACAHARQRRRDNIEEHLAYEKRWRENNRDKVSAASKRSKQKQIGTGQHRYYGLKHRAGKRNVPCTLERKAFTAWFVAQEKVCYYCGRPFEQVTNRGKRGCGLTVDCKDAAKGYVEGNIVLACHRCNTMKGNWLSENQMLDAARRYFIDKSVH